MLLFNPVCAKLTYKALGLTSQVWGSEYRRIACQFLTGIPITLHYKLTLMNSRT